MGNGVPSGRLIPQGGLSLLGVFIPRQMGFQVFLRLERGSGRVWESLLSDAWRMVDASIVIF